jgi:hypothetical protein
MVPTTYVPSQDASAMYVMNNGGGMFVPISTTPAPSAAKGTPGAQQPQEPSQTPPQPSPTPSETKLLTAGPEQKRDKNPGRKEQTADSQPKQSAKAKSRAQGSGDGVIDNLSSDKKEVICKYIYDLMVQKKFTNPDGYLIIDVCSEVLKEMGESNAQSWRTSQARFADLLRCAPQYFRLFRKSIRISNACGWYTRRGQKMVCLVQDQSK